MTRVRLDKDNCNNSNSELKETFQVATENPWTYVGVVEYTHLAKMTIVLIRRVIFGRIT